MVLPPVASVTRWTSQRAVRAAGELVGVQQCAGGAVRGGVGAGEDQRAGDVLTGHEPFPGDVHQRRLGLPPPPARARLHHRLRHFRFGCGRRGLAARTSVKVVPSTSCTSTGTARARSWLAWSMICGNDARVHAASPGSGSYTVPSMVAVIVPSRATVSTTSGRSTGTGRVQCDGCSCPSAAPTHCRNPALPR